VIQDDKNDATEAANVANLLVNQHRVKAIVGSVTSKATIPSPTSSRPGRSRRFPRRHQPEGDGGGRERKDYMFRACFIDPFQGAVLAKFAQDTLKKKNAAVLYDASNDYSKGSPRSSATPPEAGGKVAAFESYGKDDVDSPRC